MKYNPALNEEIAALPGFTGIHPLQPEYTAQGCMEVLAEAERILCAVTGMEAMTFQPAAGAHGEFTGLLLIKAYHRSRGDLQRTKILVPDSAHGTNPASATMTGFEVVNVPSSPDGCVDLDALRKAAGPDTAGSVSYTHLNRARHAQHAGPRWRRDGGALCKQLCDRRRKGRGPGNF